MRTGRNNKNGGFSLGGTYYCHRDHGDRGDGHGTVRGNTDRQKKSQKCADEIVSTLERARVLTLGKEQNQVEFVTDRCEW